MPLSPGTRLGTYEILTPLGAGGMGEVYRGRDTRLDREVAVKVLPDAVAQDRERLARFEREARVLASLNHPNIAQIYGFEEKGETRALIMELVTGSTLPVPQPIETAIEYARQIAEALEAAHERGITHRDLKPANIMITADGAVKVLDFGLATAPGRETGGDPALSPTFTMDATQAGMIMGTAAYMSPEQAAGKAVDKRSDIWSFGVVLYEMLSGVKLFEGETVAHTLADVLRAPVDLAKLNATVPAPIADLLNRCLDREPKTRLRDIGEARIAIQKYLADPNRGTSSVRQNMPPAPSRLPWILAAGLALVAAGFGYQAYRQAAAPPAKTIKSFILPPGKNSFVNSSPPALSPDGRKLAFTAAGIEKPVLWLRDLDSLTARSITGTEGAEHPFWSPDSQSVGFFADGKLKRIDLSGGTVLTLCATEGLAHGASWSSRGVILFPKSSNSGLSRVASTGGSPAPVTTLDEAAGETSHRLPWFLPDGRHFLYSVRNQEQAAKSLVYGGDLDSKDRVIVLRGEAHAAYVPAGGFLVFTAGGGMETPLMAQTMDDSTFRLAGAPFPIAESIDRSPSIWAQYQFSVAQDGTLVYSAGGARPRQLTWMDRSGKVLGTLNSTGGGLRTVAISPDGRTVATDTMQPGGGDIWLHDVTRGALSRFTFYGAGTGAVSPSWSPDGNELTFSVYSGLRGTVMRQSLGGRGAAEPVGAVWGDPPRRVNSQTWSPDGRFVVARLNAGGSTTGADIWMMPLSPAGEKPRPYLQSQANEASPSITPASDWLAYASDETRRFEIYVQSFPTPGRKYQVSVKGGASPVWSRDGKELFFIAPDRQMMAATVRNSGGRLEIGTPKALFDSQMRWDLNATFDVAKDGRFLIPVQEETASVPLTLVTNWQVGVNK